MHRSTQDRQIGQLRLSLRRQRGETAEAWAQLEQTQKTLDLWRGIAIVLSFALALSWAF